jgi:predicted CoA-binding protein
LELPCFISLSLVPTWRPNLFRAPFSAGGRVIGTGSYPDALLRAILTRTRTIACVGVSRNQVRPSFYVARYLALKGFRVIPVNPAYAGETLLGETVLPDLASLPDGVAMVDIFRRSSEAGAVVDAALAHLLGRGLETIWMQIGVTDAAAAARAEAAGLTVIMNRCPKIEYMRLFGELGWQGINTAVLTSRRRPLTRAVRKLM